jgi:hypothetical protein
MLHAVRDRTKNLGYADVWSRELRIAYTPMPASPHRRVRPSVTGAGPATVRTAGGPLVVLMRTFLADPLSHLAQRMEALSGEYTSALAQIGDAGGPAFP